jgi:[ribosomal protein S5]-alanine N-acetyltransferase
MISFAPFPTLPTERLILRQLAFQDEQEIFFLRSDKRVNKYLVAPIAQNVEEAWEFITKINTGIVNNEWIYWGITLKNDNKLIGTICFWNISIEENKAEIGYVLHPGCQGKGLMQEAIYKVIEYGFEVMKLQSMEAVLHPDNERSIVLLKRNGFVYKGELDNDVVYKLINSTGKQQL